MIQVNQFKVETFNIEMRINMMYESTSPSSPIGDIVKENLWTQIRLNSTILINIKL